MNSEPRPTDAEPLPRPSRREALKSLLGLGVALVAGDLFAGDVAAPTSDRDRMGALLPQRKLGRKGPTLPMLGLGGAHIGLMARDATAQETIETAMAGGIRYFETAAGYSQGRSEVRYGQFLTPKYRDLIFLATKTQSSDAPRARRELDQSLKRMKTDYLDLWHLHSLHSAEDADHRIANGVLDVLLEAKASGKVRHIGFTGHLTPDSHLHMLSRAGEKGDPFTACQMPINAVDPSYHSFVLNVVPRAVAAGLGVLAMKTLANGGLFQRAKSAGGATAAAIPDRIRVADALNFAWSLPISVLVTGADNPAMLQEKIDLARQFQQMEEPQRAALIAKVADLAGPTVETYKVPPR